MFTEPKKKTVTWSTHSSILVDHMSHKHIFLYECLWGTSVHFDFMHEMPPKMTGSEPLHHFCYTEAPKGSGNDRPINQIHVSVGAVKSGPQGFCPLQASIVKSLKLQWRPNKESRVAGIREAFERSHRDQSSRWIIQCKKATLKIKNKLF